MKYYSVWGNPGLLNRIIFKEIISDYVKLHNKVPFHSVNLTFISGLLNQPDIFAIMPTKFQKNFNEILHYNILKRY